MDLKFWNWKIKKGVPTMEDPPPPPLPKSSTITFIGDGRVGYNPIIDDIYDGEKTPGEMGAVRNTVPDHLRLRLRAYELNLKTDLIKVITGKFFKWVIGSGLKLQSEPSEEVLKIFGADFDTSMFKKQVEALFELHAKSRLSDYQRKDWLHKKATEAFKAAFLGGDCLCVLRYDDEGVNIQIIDGQQVQNPFEDTRKEKGNEIKKGIELNEKGEHVAFWVNVEGSENAIEHERIPARNSNGNLVAWMIYGTKERLDHHRGIPVISSILEKVTKFDRFIEATVKKAEETANVVYAFEHDENSTGENILTQQLSSKVMATESPETVFEKTGRTAAQLRQSTSSTVLNLVPGSKLQSLSNPSEATFGEFFRAVFDVIAASVDCPAEVALQKFDQNYSSSRAAINSWEHIVSVYREDFAKNFYEPFYRFWLEIQILEGNINAPKFLELKNSKKHMALEAYFNARFTGKKMPHIDPKKEADAIRAMLGLQNANIPLISLEQATELLGGGDWEANYAKYTEERKLIPKEDVAIQNNQQKSDVGGSNSSESRADNKS